MSSDTNEAPKLKPVEDNADSSGDEEFDDDDLEEFTASRTIAIRVGNRRLLVSGESVAEAKSLLRSAIDGALVLGGGRPQEPEAP